MRGLLRLIRAELGLLKRTVLLTALILTVFLAALYGVLSVRIDLERGFYAHIDGLSVRSYAFVEDAGLEVLSACPDGIVWATGGDLLNPSRLTGAGGSFELVQSETDKDGTVSLTRHYGEAVASNAETRAYLSERYGGRLKEGRWCEAAGEIVLSTLARDGLGAAVGDRVNAGGIGYTVVGIYEMAPYDRLTLVRLDAAFLVVPATGAAFGQVNVSYPSARAMFGGYRALLHAGFSATVGNLLGNLYSSLTVMSALLWAVAALFFAVVFLLFYTLVSTLLRSRKKQICRMKLLGGRDGLIACVYCTIVIVLLAAVSLLAAGLGVWFDRYFMRLLASLFGFPFGARFEPLIPLAGFAALSLCSFLVWFSIDRRAAARTAAIEVRNE